MRLLAATLLMACLCWGAQDPSCPPPPSHLSLRKGEYTSRPGVVFVLENFSATMVPRSNKPPLCYVKSTEIDRGRVLVSAESLSKLFLVKVEDPPGKGDGSNGKQGKGEDKKSSISDVKIRISGADIVISGKVHKLVGVPFEIKGPVDVVGGRLLRVHVEKIKAAGLEVKGLLDMLGVHLTQVLNPEAANGVKVQENVILFDPELLAHVRGQISRAKVEGKDLVVDFAPRAMTLEAKHRKHQ